MLLLATLAFVTLTLIETSFIAILRRVREFEKHKGAKGKQGEQKELMNVRYQPPVEGISDSNENELSPLDFSETEFYYRQKCTRIDIICFISFISIYAAFILVYLYLLL